MKSIHTTPQIIEVANFALLRAIIITLENKGILSTGDIHGLADMAIDMCHRTRNEDPKSSIGAAQLIDGWVKDSF